MGDELGSSGLDGYERLLVKKRVMITTGCPHCHDKDAVGLVHPDGRIICSKCGASLN